MDAVGSFAGAGGVSFATGIFGFDRIRRGRCRGRAGAEQTGGARIDAGDRGAGGRAAQDAGLVGTGGGTAECTTPLTSDVFDPANIYLAGTLQEGACYRDAIASWTCPSTAVTGFSCDFDNNSTGAERTSAQIRPSDGRLLYANAFEGLDSRVPLRRLPVCTRQLLPRRPARQRHRRPHGLQSGGRPHIFSRFADWSRRLLLRRRPRMARPIPQVRSP